uniref:Uncharacterized protein n=1 Tax=Tetranychus urticae TaxID=32264 RepID=T1KW93_TETUR
MPSEFYSGLPVFLTLTLIDICQHAVHYLQGIIFQLELAFFYQCPSHLNHFFHKIFYQIVHHFSMAMNSGCFRLGWLSLLWQCQFYEVSAAESYIGVSLAFQSLIREAKPCALLKTLPPMRRKTSPAMIGKMIGIVFGKTGSKSSRNGKKRPSLSI